MLSDLVAVHQQGCDVSGKRNLLREALALVIVEEKHEDEGQFVSRIPDGNVLSIDHALQVVLYVAMQFHELPRIGLQCVFSVFSVESGIRCPRFFHSRQFFSTF